MLRVMRYVGQFVLLSAVITAIASAQIVAGVSYNKQKAVGWRSFRP